MFPAKMRSDPPPFFVGEDLFFPSLDGFIFFFFDEKKPRRKLGHLSPSLFYDLSVGLRGAEFPSENDELDAL